jgi:peptidoglycan/LPS O-acetylase OafA/YrhL
MKHDNAFDVLRLFAALLVIFGHAFRLTGEAGVTFAGTGVATTGVKIFFVISGYLVAQSLLRDGDPRRFLQRRLLRIVPGLAAVVVLTAFVLGPALSTLSVPAYFAAPGTWAYLANLAFHPADALPGMFAANIAPDEVNGSLWSLAPEMSMYLLLPALAAVSFALTRAYRMFALAAGLVTVVGMLVVSSDELRGWLVYGTRVWAWFSVAPFFLFGACYALLKWDRYLNRAVALVSLALLLAMPAVPIVTELMLIAALPYVVLAFGVAPAPFGGALTRRGDFSYGLYLYAFPIQQALVATIGTAGGALGNFALATLLAGSCAALSWYLIERPALRWKPAPAPRPLPAQAVPARP